MNPFVQIAKRDIGSGQPVYVIAEISANHNQSFESAVELIHAAKRAGADAVKLQTYTADTLTLDCDQTPFQISQGTIWDGQTLYQLYEQAFTPWEWQPRLKKIANSLDLALFSSPFDTTAVDFLMQMDVPAFKIASFEIVDVALLAAVARTGKPVIVSTGMATLPEIQRAIATLIDNGCDQMALLKCTSSYPAPPESMNLKTIPDWIERFGVPVGLSDHTLGIESSIAAVALGGSIIEKHLTLSRRIKGPDSAFSLEPDEFKQMVDSVRTTQAALGKVRFGPSQHDQANRAFRRSLFVVRPVDAGEIFTLENVRSIRPGHGLEPRFLQFIIGKKATVSIPRGTPLDWAHIDGLDATIACESRAIAELTAN